MSAPHARIASVESGSTTPAAWIMAWVFATVFLGAFLVAALAGKGWVGPVVAGLLAAFALGWLASLWRTSRSLARHGEGYVELTAPAAPGDTLRGTVHMANGVGPLSRLVATLTCTLWTQKGATTTELWSARQVVEAVRTGDSVEASFSFDIPGDAPHTRLPPVLRNDLDRSFAGGPTGHTGDYFVWELAISSGLRGHDVERHFRVPVGVDEKHPDAFGMASSRAPDTPAPKPGLVPVIALVAANLVPIAGVVYFGWKLGDIIMLFWMENLIIGAFNVLRILTLDADRFERFRPDGVGSDLATRLGLAIFFTVHYGIFSVFHGIFLAYFFARERSGFDFFAPLANIVGDMIRDPVIGVALIGLVLSHGISFLRNHIRRGERHRLDPVQMMMRPYGRIVVTQGFIIVGGFLLIQTGEPLAALLLFIALKILLDLGSHIWEHSGRRAGAAQR